MSMVASDSDSGEKRVRKEIYNFPKDQCPGHDVSLSMVDNYLRGTLEQGESVLLKLNWFLCHDMELGDLVAYRFSEYHDPVIRRVIAKSGDRIQVVFDDKTKDWTLKINGSFYKDYSGELYHFGTQRGEPPLKLYERDHGGVLTKDLVVLMSTVTPGLTDSGFFGVVHRSDVIGLIQKKVSVPEKKDE